MRLLGQYLEFYDSADFDDRSELLVADNKGRLLDVLVDMHVVKKLEIVDGNPDSDALLLIETAKRTRGITDDQNRDRTGDRD